MEWTHVGNGKNRPRDVPSNLVHLPVESAVIVSVVNDDHLARFRYGSRNADPDRNPNLDHVVRKVRVDLVVVVVDEEEMRKMSMGEVTAARHLALEIDDYDAAKQTLEAAGLEFRENVAGTNLQIFLRDPAGNVVELIVPDGALKR